MQEATTQPEHHQAHSASIWESILDFSKIKSDFRKEIVREGTVYLDGQLRIATSADSRASGLAGIFTAAATALTAGIVITIFNAAGTSLQSKLPLMLGGASAAILILGRRCALHCCNPARELLVAGAGSRKLGYRYRQRP